MKSLVLFSGGQDSTTCLAKALSDFPENVTAIGFDYGQRHTVELKQAKIIAKKANVPFHVLNLDFFKMLTPNALINSTIKIEQKQNSLPSTFVPGRNLFFLTAAAVKARELGIHILYTGVCQTDYSGYPDCREDFISSAQKTISLAIDYAIEIRTPLMYLTKSETILMMKKLNKLEWYQDSHTCYKGERPACGECPACILRLKGFKNANLIDPLAYQKRITN